MNISEPRTITNRVEKFQTFLHAILQQVRYLLLQYEQKIWITVTFFFRTLICYQNHPETLIKFYKVS